MAASYQFGMDEYFDQLWHIVYRSTTESPEPQPCLVDGEARLSCGDHGQYLDKATGVNAGEPTRPQQGLGALFGPPLTEQVTQQGGYVLIGTVGIDGGIFTLI